MVGWDYKVDAGMSCLDSATKGVGNHINFTVDRESHDEYLYQFTTNKSFQDQLKLLAGEVCPNAVWPACTNACLRQQCCTAVVVIANTVAFVCPGRAI